MSFRLHHVADAEPSLAIARVVDLAVNARLAIGRSVDLKAEGLWLDSARRPNLCSRKHASIVTNTFGAIIEDHGSVNGVFINNVRINAGTPTNLKQVGCSIARQ
jgi:pSer/pThr/pTyr-binding forkhead associated (FHA) protein